MELRKMRSLARWRKVQRRRGETGTEPSNKEMKLTSVERIGRSRLVPGVLRSSELRRGQGLMGSITDGVGCR